MKKYGSHLFVVVISIFISAQIAFAIPNNQLYISNVDAGAKFTYNDGIIVYTATDQKTIKYKNLVSGSSGNVTDSSYSRMSPAVSGDWVVYMESHGAGDIYAKNLSTSEVLPISTTPGDKWHPDISGNNVVWWDNRNGTWDIYRYDLSTRQEYAVTNEVKDQTWPDVQGDKVVYTHGRKIDVYDISLDQYETLPIGSSIHYYPSIYGNIVTWTDDRNGNWDIYAYDLATNTEFQVTSDVGGQYGSKVYGDFIVWTDVRSGNDDIYAYHMPTSTEFQVTSDLGSQRGPSIYNDTVMWYDDRNGTEDIYGATLNAPVVPEPISSLLFVTGSILLVGRRYIKRKA